MENKLFQEKWTALQTKIKQKWPKFSDQDLKHINGEKNKFMNELQKKYGLDRNHAEKELETLSGSLVAAGAQKNESKATAGMQKNESKAAPGQKGHSTNPGKK